MAWYLAFDELEFDDIYCIKFGFDDLLIRDLLQSVWEDLLVDQSFIAERFWYSVI